MRMDRRDPHGFHLVGDILGAPVAVEPARPATLGGATPVEHEPPGRPLYRVGKECRVCKRAYMGLSFAPQYDDDPPQYGWCGCARGASAGDGRWTTDRARPHLTGSAPARRARDPLLDD